MRQYLGPSYGQFDAYKMLVASMVVRLWDGSQIEATVRAGISLMAGLAARSEFGVVSLGKCVARPGRENSLS